MGSNELKKQSKSKRKAEEIRKNTKKTENTAKIKKKAPAKAKTIGAKASEKVNAKTKVKLRPLNRSKLLVSVVGQKDEIKLKEVLDDISVSLSFSFAGKGTARSAVLDYLGIGETEKTIVLSLIPESDEDRVIRMIRQEMALYLVGRGISFTVPLSGISEIVANGISAAASNKDVDRRKVMTSEDRKYDLIVVSVEANHVDEAMEAAHAAGAAGGTVIRARSLNNAKAEQFIGISLLEKREIIIILTKKEGKLAIMQALSEKVGLKTEAGGVIFSLPVDRTAGISAADEESIEKQEEPVEDAKPQETVKTPEAAQEENE